jgi:hypothetical protein
MIGVNLSEVKPEYFFFFKPLGLVGVKAKDGWMYYYSDITGKWIMQNYFLGEIK